MIVSTSIGLVALFTVPETFAPVLLQRKAARLRQETKDWAIHSTLDENPVNFRRLVEKYLSKPLVMLVKDPIVSWLSLQEIVDILTHM